MTCPVTFRLSSNNNSFDFLYLISIFITLFSLLIETLVDLQKNSVKKLIFIDLWILVYIKLNDGLIILVRY